MEVRDARELYDRHDRVRKGALTDAPDTVQTVQHGGFFTKVCQFDDDALDLLLLLAQKEEPNMGWTHESILEYIKFTWLRLLELKRVVWVKGADSHQLKPLTQYFILFHSGLFVKKHGKLQPLYLVAVQVKNERVFFIHVSGIVVGRNKLAVHVALTPPTGCAVHGSLQRATYYAISDPLLLFNISLPFVYNAHHMLVDRKFRILAYLKDNNVISGDIDQEALIQLMEQWMMESVFYCGRSFFGCAVPQLYYKLVDGGYYGSRQLLLPLFCGTGKAILALPVEYIASYEPCNSDKLVFNTGDVERLLNGENVAQTQRGAPSIEAGQACYKAHTALPLAWARMNARLVDVPQAHWLVN